MALTYEELIGIQNKRKKQTQQEQKVTVTTGKQSGGRLVKPVDDIAPVKKFTPTVTTSTKEKEDDRTWFKKSSYFDDGYQFGDITKTILGTGVDVAEKLTSGFAGAPEKLIDSFAGVSTLLGNAQMGQLSNDAMAFAALTGKKEQAGSIAKSFNSMQKAATKGTTEFVKKDLYNEDDIAKKLISAPVKEMTGLDAGAASVMGDKLGGVIKSIGNTAATKLVGTIFGGGMGYLMTGFTAGGGEVEEALREGATFEGAMASGIITGSSEAAGGMLFNGVKLGGQTLTENSVQYVARALSGKTLQTLAKWGINTVGEGAEEVVSDFISSIGKKLTYLNEKEFNEIFSSQDAWESFLGGMITGGLFEGTDVVAHKIKGTDYVTGLSNNEQKVVDKEIENLIAEKEAQGEKLTSKDKKKIRDEVYTALEKGYISTDTIESVLGGKDYESYKKATDDTKGKEKTFNDMIEGIQNKMNTLQQEYDTLNKMKRGDMTGEQQDRQASIKQELAAMEKNVENLKNGFENVKAEGKTTAEELKATLGENVRKLVEGSKLEETYRELDRAKESFKADVSKFESSKHSDAAKKTLENAVKANANNTNRVRDLVELQATIAGDTGTVFDFRSGEQIKAEFIERQGKRISELESIPEAERTEAQTKLLAAMKTALEKVKSGETVINGVITDEGVMLNLDSDKLLNRTTGHEITHRLEKTGAYVDLKEALFKYAESKGLDIKGKLAEIEALYDGVENSSKAEAELVSELVGDYLLTDYDFIKQISVENRNVFQRLWDEVKYLCKVASAGSKEARVFEKVKRSFEKAYKEAAVEKNNTAEGGVNAKYSLSANAESELHKALYDKNYRNEVLLRDETPEIMLSQKGVKNHKMVMNASHIRENVFTEAEAQKLGLKVDNHTHYHGIGEEYFLKIIDSLDNVKEAYRGTKNSSDSSRRENYFLLVTEFKDDNGNVINVPVFIDEIAQCNRVFIQTNKIATVFGRDNFREYINRQIREKNLIRVNNKSNTFSEGDALIAPAYESIAPSDSIPDSTENVNTSDSFSLSAKSKNTGNIVAPMRHEITGKDFGVKGADGTTQDAQTAGQQELAPVGRISIETKKKEAVKENLFPMLDESEVATDQKTEQRPSEEILGESQVKAGDPKKNKDRMWPSFVRNFVSKGSVFETFALQTKNRAVEDKYKMWKDRSEAKAQYFMENGKGNTKSLKAIRDQITKSGLEKEFDLYMKHRLNVDRMKEDKPVFGYDITAEASLKTANKLQEQHPEFKEWAKDVYAYNDYLRQMMVDGGLLAQETADLWAKKYPNYIPIERLTDESVKRGGEGVGISAPVKKSTGGNSTMETLLNTLAHRTTQVFKAIDKNAFGVELKNALYTDEVVSDVTADEIIDNVPLLDDGSLIKPGVDGNAPTFTVFENGKRVTFNIKEEMYEALKPTPEGLSKTFKVPHTASSWHKKVLTEYNLFFTARNFPKDAQEVIFNSRHAAKTYANMPVAFKELLTEKGKYVQEYWENGGKSNTYFDREANAFENDKGKIKKALGFVPDQISKVNDFVEAIPRLAEYIASRKKGATIEASMLDAARVTTDFSDGGDITKFLNRNGATFLNASVQGAAQQVRNIRQAKAEGFKGIMKLIGKYALSGLPVLLFNNLIWDDDEEYEELSEYVKDNYYVIAKYGDGKFVRIPKGRTAAVLQDAVEQISNTVTGKESDWLNCLELLTSNLAPNNPIDNNIFAPLFQAKKGETWYGEDLVPARLQKLPAREQYDEAVDSISKWLGEHTGISPYKINYVLNQYSGFVGDMVLPALTPEAENGNNSVLGNMIAPLKDQFTTDSVLKNNAPSDFFSLSDELEINSNSKNATDEDKLKYKYISSVSSEISDLYKQKREIQNSDLSDKLKFEQVRDIQKQINETAKKALNGYEDVKIDKRYAKAGGIQYRFNDEGEWQKLTDEQLKKQKEVTGILGITPGEYWSNKDVYDMKALKPELYKALQEEGVSVKHYKENIEKWIHLPNDDYSWAANNPDKATFSKAFYDSVVDYRKMTSELYDIKADKDENGNSISGSAKEKKKAYIWSLDIPEGAKHLLFRSEYNSYDDYNAEIIEYVNGLKLTTAEKKTVLEKAGFKVEDNGRITWD